MLTLSLGDHTEPHSGTVGLRKGHLEHPSQGASKMLSNLSFPVSSGTGTQQDPEHPKGVRGLGWLCDAYLSIASLSVR